MISYLTLCWSSLALVSRYCCCERSAPKLGTGRPSTMWVVGVQSGVAKWVTSWLPKKLQSIHLAGSILPCWHWRISPQNCLDLARLLVGTAWWKGLQAGAASIRYGRYVNGIIMSSLLHHCFITWRKVSLPTCTFPIARSFFLPSLQRSSSFFLREQSPPQHLAVTCFLMWGISSLAMVLVPMRAWMLTAKRWGGMFSLIFPQMALVQSQAFFSWTRKVRASTGSFMMWMTTLTMSARSNSPYSYSNDPNPWVIDFILSTKSTIISARGSLYFKMVLRSLDCYSMNTPLRTSQSILSYLMYSWGATRVQKVVGSMKYYARSFSGASAALSMSMIFVFSLDLALVGDAGGGEDGLHAELVLEPLPEDVHVQHPQEPTAEPAAQSRAALPYVRHRRVRQHQLLQTTQSRAYFFSSCPKSSESSGQTPAYIMGLAGLKPGSAGTLSPILWKVSPMRASLTCFMLLTTQPICPGRREGLAVSSGSRSPTSKTWQGFPEKQLTMLEPFLSSPLMMQKRQMTFLLLTNQLLTRKSLSLSVSLPTGGGGISLTMRWRMDSTLRAVLALILLISTSCMPSSSRISRSMVGMSQMASILFSTGSTFSRSFFASSKLAIVCAWIPCVTSTSSSAPWHPRIDRSTSQWKSTCPGVSTRFSRYWRPLQTQSMEAVCAWTVMPRSRSTFSLSRYWLAEFLGMVLVISRRRSARVDFPWSMCAMMQKLRMHSGAIWLEHQYLIILRILNELAKRPTSTPTQPPPSFNQNTPQPSPRQNDASSDQNKCCYDCYEGRRGWWVGKHNNQFLFIMTSWYGKSASKQIEALLESKPKLHQLLAIGEFTQELKSYNSKLLDYITCNSWLISEAVVYLTVAPQPTDSNDRKYKLPLQVIEMIETETTCILNGFFKEGEDKELLNFDLLFSVLDQPDILPLLAGYFFRTNLCLLNNRYKETVDRIYSKPRIFHSLISHAHHMAISNTIQLFLNLDINKTANSHPEKLAVKLDIMRAIIKKIEYEHKTRSQDSAAIIENLCSVLIETVDKYYLIVDGKQMIEVITDQPSVEIMMRLIRENSELAFPAFSYFISLINYYSFSSFNSDEAQNTELARKNTERLESQPMINELLNYFPAAIDKIVSAARFDLYHYKLLEVLCHCISVSSMKIYRKICETRFFGCLINLLFRHEYNNILHMLIEKSFYHVFISERKIYEEYKKHLFCELDIIDITVNRILKLHREDAFLEQAKTKAYFGHFMRILKIYSGIQPTDQRIIAAIKAKTNTWNKISEILIKPYEAICFKELGSYENFTVKKENNVLTPAVNQNNTAISEIEKEEHFPIATPALTHEKKEDSGQHNYLFDCEPANLNMKIENLPLITAEQKDLKKTESFKEFISKKKVEAEQEIKVKRSLSQDKKLSNSSRGKMTSPSPGKKNSWKEKDDKTEEKTLDRSINSQPSIPKVPISRRNVGPASNIPSGERENRLIQEDRRASKSVNMEEIRKIKVIQIDPPKQKKYRKAEEKDKLFLDFLGISV